VFEITMTVPDAPGLIRRLAADAALLVGAGTVPDRAAAEACLDAGARFLVAPWVDAAIGDATRARGACALLGAMTPTEVRGALAAGADAVKIFPASSAGGPAHIKALRSVFPDVAFCPTGGVDARTAPDYFAAGAAFVGIGGRLVDEGLLARGDRAAVEQAAREVLGIMQA
jgi:2-dehydro-3-deoxyphosphogluconate aldolase/(4S)-4-hydroxy-2-oxoglutarate aldolase